jgi:hypothetical protein
MIDGISTEEAINNINSFIEYYNSGEWVYDGDCMIASCCNTAYDIDKFKRVGDLICLPCKCPNCGCEKMIIAYKD